MECRRRKEAVVLMMRWTQRRIVPLLFGAVTAVVQAPRALAQSMDAPRRALSELLADASQRNVLPPDLLSFKSHVETEISVLLRREEGTEAVAAVEQVASSLRWTRTGYYDQHIVGYRAQQSGPNVSMLSVFRVGWLTPLLYGNRLTIRTRAARSPARAAMRGDGADTLPAVHPLAIDRDRYYTFSGGDTIVTIKSGDRTIPIAHVRVMPRRDLTSHVLLFDGELDLDATRGTLVRMRGTFVRLGSANQRRVSIGEAVAFIEYENAERYGAYWLPARQRIELQATFPMLGDARAVVRIVSKFSDMVVNDTAIVLAARMPDDSTLVRWRRRLTFASKDSIDQYAAWASSVGALSEGMHSDDFMDIAPDRWRPTGLPRLDWVVPRASDLFHFNRVEGAYTGYGLKWSLRDVAPGVVVRANAGYAWGDQAMRGRLSIERKRGPWQVELRGGRSMDNTNDFRIPFDSGNTFGALFASQDPYDYVDRTSATVGISRTLGKRSLITRAEVGVADDRYRPSTYVRSPFGGEAYRPNRGIDEGSYVRSAASVEWHPDISAEFVNPGLGARLLYERGDGNLSYQRMEARVVGRKPFGPFVAILRGDVGTVISDRPPPQQLFELGEQQNLPGYLDKEFAGTRAASVLGSLQYTSPFLRRPIRVRRLFLPAIAPGLSVGVQSGWTEAPTDAGKAAIGRLAVIDPNLLALWAPVSRPSDGIRASVTAGLRFFSGGAFVGVTRPVDQAAKWKALVTFGQQW